MLFLLFESSYFEYLFVSFLDPLIRIDHTVKQLYDLFQPKGQNYEAFMDGIYIVQTLT